MIRIRTALSAAVLALGVATMAQAQNPAPQGQPPAQGGMGMGRGGMMGQMLLKDITLTADQQTKVDAIQAKYREQMQAARAEMQGGDRDAARAKMRDLMSKESDEIKAVLTDDQKKQFDANVKDMEARRQQMMQQGGGARPPVI